MPLLFKTTAAAFGLRDGYVQVTVDRMNDLAGFG